MYNKKIQLKISKTAFQPAIAAVELSPEGYQALESWRGSDHQLFLIEDAGKAELDCQLCSLGLEATPEGVKPEYRLFILVNDLAVIGDEQTFTFSFARKETVEVVLPKDHAYNPWAKTTGVFLDPQPGSARTIVAIGGHLFTRYLYSHDQPKPYYYPLIGPKEKTLIQDGPDDHLHHHGLWWGHDGVNGNQLYHEFHGEGRQSHRKFLAQFGGPVVGQITSVIDWCTAAGKRLLQETRTMRIYNLPGEARYVDLCTQLHATDGDVEFSDSKEGGFPFIRVNEQICAMQSGTITASTGKTGEAQIFGQEADWVDYSGKILDIDYRPLFSEDPELRKKGPIKSMLDAGIAILLHPDSDDYPAKWFVRDSGAFNSSNFHFAGGHLLIAGSTYTFKQRIYIHKEDCEGAQVAQRYEEYTNPLVAEMG